MELLHLDKVRIDVAGVPLIEGFDLRVGPGECVAIMGPSGCGKTTLLRTVAALIHPAGGRIAYKGRTAAEIGVPAYRRRVVLVHQRPVVLEGTVRQNLQRPFRYQSCTQAFPEKAAVHWLERLGLGAEVMDRDARTLSIGQQQRLVLIRALLIEPAVLLLDEPTSGLDAETAERIEDILLDETRRRDSAILVVAHDRQQPHRWCDRIVSLEVPKLQPAWPDGRASAKPTQPGDA